MSSTTKKPVSGAVKPPTRKPVPALDGAGSSKEITKQRKTDSADDRTQMTHPKEKRDKNFLDGEFDEDGANKDGTAPPDPYTIMLGTFFTAVLDSSFPAAADRNKDLPKTPSDRNKKLPNEKDLPTVPLLPTQQHEHAAKPAGKLKVTNR